MEGNISNNITNVETKTASQQNIVPEKSISQKSLDLDELFGFTEARRKLEYGDEEAPAEPTFIPRRIFLNNVDSFNGRHITEFLSDQVMGGLKSQGEAEEEEEEELVEEEYDEDEEEEGKRKLRKEKKPLVKMNYEIIGTVTDPMCKETQNVLESITNPSDRQAFLPIILKCGFIIYDITTDKSQILEARWTLKAIETHLDKLQEEEPKTFKKMTEIRHFVLLSTVMTWALSKPVDPDDPEQAFTEADFRKRKPHPNYKDHIELEKEVTQTGKKYKDKFKTLVIAAGITYGKEEDILHLLFKKAWQNKPELPVFLPGKNLIPLIHIMDLASILYNILEAFPTRRRYILAVEMTVSSLKDIVKAISSTLSSGKCKKIAKEEAFLIPEITQKFYEMMTVNLNMEPMYIVENMNINWVSELGFVENIQQIVTEYKESRHLKPLRIFLHGPPAVGKTRIAKRLCAYYQLHYLHKKDVVNEAITELKNRAETVKSKEKEASEEEGEEEEEEDEENEMEENLEDIYVLLEDIETNKNENNGKLDDSYVIRFFKEKMMSSPCQNQGYVLDGYPTTIEIAKTLFESAEDEEEAEEEEEEGEGSYNKKIMPDYVINMNTSDDVLYARVMELPEKVIQGTKYTEENMIRRLREFRQNNSDENTVLNYFDELEIHPLLIDVTDDSTLYMEKTFKTITERIGKPRNYGEAIVEDEISKLAKLVNEQEALEEEKRKEGIVKKAIEEQRTKMEEWANLLDALKEEEEELLTIQGIPVRHYLMRYVFPTLTRGLLEVAYVRPDDPVDYLAEYLFRENPEGKMFHPDYVEAAEDFMNAVQQFRDSLIKADSLTSHDQDSTFKPYDRLQQHRNQITTSYSHISPIESREELAYEPQREYQQEVSIEEESLLDKPSKSPSIQPLVSDSKKQEEKLEFVQSEEKHKFERAEDEPSSNLTESKEGSDTGV